jgi:hypothetical protein
VGRNVNNIELIASEQQQQHQPSLTHVNRVIEVNDNGVNRGYNEAQLTDLDLPPPYPGTPVKFTDPKSA